MIITRIMVMAKLVTEGTTVKDGELSSGMAEDLAMDLLGRVGVASQASKMPSQLSGGQQQRVCAG